MNTAYIKTLTFPFQCVAHENRDRLLLIFGLSAKVILKLMIVAYDYWCEDFFGLFAICTCYIQTKRQTDAHTHTQRERERERDVISSTRTHLIYTHTHANCLLYISAHGVAKPGPRSITSTFADRVIRGRVVDIYLFLRLTTKTQQMHASTEFSQCFNHKRD